MTSSHGNDSMKEARNAEPQDPKCWECEGPITDASVTCGYCEVKMHARCFADKQFDHGEGICVPWR